MLIFIRKDHLMCFENNSFKIWNISCRIDCFIWWISKFLLIHLTFINFCLDFLKLSSNECTYKNCAECTKDFHCNIRDECQRNKCVKMSDLIEDILKVRKSQKEKCLYFFYLTHFRPFAHRGIWLKFFPHFQIL